MAHRIPLRAYFKTKTVPRTFEEARNVYSFFASKGELIEFRFTRDPDVKKIRSFGWISYKDSKITEQLFENWFKIEPCNIEAIVHRAKKNNKKLEERPISKIMFGGFYLKDDDKTSSSSTFNQNNDNLTSKDNQIRETMITEDSIEEFLETSENQKESTNHTKNTIIENTATTIETRVEAQ